MIPVVPAILLTMSSPYFKALQASWRRNRKKLINTDEQLTYILEETQTDVFNQFSENQSKWRALAKFTVDKKKRNKSDPRILHESKTIGSRLKDAYAASGYVRDGQLVYHYPPSKPYAIEHQEGASIPNPRGEAKKKRRKNRHSSVDEKKLDAEYLRRVGLPKSFAHLFD